MKLAYNNLNKSGNVNTTKLESKYLLLEYVRFIIVQQFMIFQNKATRIIRFTYEDLDKVSFARVRLICS